MTKPCRLCGAVRHSIIVVLIAQALACGGGTSPTAPSGAPYIWEISDAVPPHGITRQILTVPRGGTLSLEVAWGNVGTDLDLYLTSPTCQGDPLATCEILARSDQKMQTILRERIVRPVTAEQQLTAWIASDASFAVTYRLTQRID